ncbi:hypothetical protein AVEN_16726-1 [Araneus ventricosus]|uniref:Uncharacterized protein n=1 Tax=Araneus ventricosus TaxID=182803 RepID=A0A4Y2GJ95_ARAVE|nr:hypothetical protein AVEN_16726-1 [Araneus ventricosus]
MSHLLPHPSKLKESASNWPSSVLKAKLSMTILEPVLGTGELNDDELYPPDKFFSNSSKQQTGDGLYGPKIIYQEGNLFLRRNSSNRREERSGLQYILKSKLHHIKHFHLYGFQLLFHGRFLDSMHPDFYFFGISDSISSSLGEFADHPQ